MPTEAKKRYRQKVKRVYIDLYLNDTDLIEHLEAQENKQGYLKSLIRADMKKIN